MRSARMYLAMALAGAVASTVAFGAGAPATISGEVIDSACYIKMGQKGADHAKCAAACGKAGIPLALLTDEGQVVWLSGDADMEGHNEKLIPHAGKRVTLEGTWHERGGTKLFAFSKVAPASPK